MSGMVQSVQCLACESDKDGIVARFLPQAKKYFSSTSSERPWAQTVSCLMGTGFVSRLLDTHHRLCAKVKNEWSRTSATPTSWHEQDNFTFLLIFIFVAHSFLLE